MKFKNETNETIKVRTGTMKSGYSWFSVAPEKEIECDETIGKDSGLTQVENNNKEKAEMHPQDADTGDDEAESGDDSESFREGLLAIKGVGPKSAAEIMEKYPTEKELRDAIAAGEETHRHDGVDEAVKEKYS